MVFLITTINSKLSFGSLFALRFDSSYLLKGSSRFYNQDCLTLETNKSVRFESSRGKGTSLSRVIRRLEVDSPSLTAKEHSHFCAQYLSQEWPELVARRVALVAARKRISNLLDRNVPLTSKQKRVFRFAPDLFFGALYSAYDCPSNLQVLLTKSVIKSLKAQFGVSWFPVDLQKSVVRERNRQAFISWVKRVALGESKQLELQDPNTGKLLPVPTLSLKTGESVQLSARWLRWVQASWGSIYQESFFRSLGSEKSKGLISASHLKLLRALVTGGLITLQMPISGIDSKRSFLSGLYTRCHLLITELEAESPENRLSYLSVAQPGRSSDLFVLLDAPINVRKDGLLSAYGPSSATHLGRREQSVVATLLHQTSQRVLELLVTTDGPRSVFVPAKRSARLFAPQQEQQLVDFLTTDRWAKRICNFLDFAPVAAIKSFLSSRPFSGFTLSKWASLLFPVFLRRPFLVDPVLIGCKPVLSGFYADKYFYPLMELIQHRSVTISLLQALAPALFELPMERLIPLLQAAIRTTPWALWRLYLLKLKTQIWLSLFVLTRSDNRFHIQLVRRMTKLLPARFTALLQQQFRKSRYQLASIRLNRWKRFDATMVKFAKASLASRSNVRVLRFLRHFLVSIGAEPLTGRPQQRALIQRFKLALERGRRQQPSIEDRVLLRRFFFFEDSLKRSRLGSSTRIATRSVRQFPSESSKNRLVPSRSNRSFKSGNREMKTTSLVTSSKKSGLRRQMTRWAQRWARFNSQKVLHKIKPVRGPSNCWRKVAQAHNESQNYRSSYQQNLRVQTPHLELPWKQLLSSPICYALLIIRLERLLERRREKIISRWLRARRFGSERVSSSFVLYKLGALIKEWIQVGSPDSQPNWPVFAKKGCKAEIIFLTRLARLALRYEPRLLGLLRRANMKLPTSVNNLRTVSYWRGRLAQSNPPGLIADRLHDLARTLLWSIADPLPVVGRFCEELVQVTDARSYQIADKIGDVNERVLSALPASLRRFWHIGKPKVRKQLDKPYLRLLTRSRSDSSIAEESAVACTHGQYYLNPLFIQERGLHLHRFVVGVFRGYEEEVYWIEVSPKNFIEVHYEDLPVYYRYVVPIDLIGEVCLLYQQVHEDGLEGEELRNPKQWVKRGETLTFEDYGLRYFIVSPATAGYLSLFADVTKNKKLSWKPTKHQVE